MADHRDIHMIPNPLYAEVSAAQNDEGTTVGNYEDVDPYVTQKVVNSRQRGIKPSARKVPIFYFLLLACVLVLLCLVVALVSVSPSKPISSLPSEPLPSSPSEPMPSSPSEPLPSSPSEPVPSSCANIIESSPLSVSGYYVVRSSSGSLVQVYCDMGVVCDGSRGWMRLVDVNYLHYSLLRNSCNTLEFLSAHRMQYGRVCGQFTGYTQLSIQNSSRQCGLPPFNPQAGIDDSYVAGFSITHGRPRQHICSLASSYEEGDWCPGFNGSATPPEFVGKNYFSGSCDSNYFDCEFLSPSWFIVNLTQPVSDNMEVRVCTGFYDDINSFYFGYGKLMIFVQ